MLNTPAVLCRQRYTFKAMTFRVGGGFLSVTSVWWRIRFHGPAQGDYHNHGHGGRALEKQVQGLPLYYYVQS